MLMFSNDGPKSTVNLQLYPLVYVIQPYAVCLKLILKSVHRRLPVLKSEEIYE